MDFSLDEDLVSLADLARTIFADLADTQRVREIESGESRIDDKLWESLGSAGLLGLVVPEDDGGAGLGLDALCVVLEEQGRTVAPVPLWSHGIAALTVANHGTEAQRTLLPALADGSVRATVALEEFGAVTPAAPQTRAEPSRDGWALTGTKAAVPTPAGAGHVLVSATGPDGPAVFLVAADAAGVSWECAATTTHDLAGHLTLDRTPAGLVPVALDHVLQQATVALAATQVGVAEGALRLAASYVSGREQFGRPLGTFQAVAHQLADCWIDVDAMRVTVWQALASLDEAAGSSSASTTADLDDAAAQAVLTAQWWAAKGGLDVVHRVQHVHGGIGVDVDYPVHRHFLWGRQLAHTLGGPSAALADLGRRIAGVA
ncbi:acyl-CoA dehydrogenase family protein [Nocardioides jensenii]|uniref:acyl-CoA dehydrogenase family protein n=1 Tax=Nocardioides jensenii TaxID=1843 RepID=UPI00082C52C1|nr:acyl-CoA dehydrogenase family protein [Nocardioides jensenii]